MNAEHRANLAKLVIELRKPVIRARDNEFAPEVIFDMAYFVRDFNENTAAYMEEKCGLHCCAAGIAAITFAPRDELESFPEYILRVFGVNTCMDTFTDTPEYLAHLWMFDSGWEFVPGQRENREGAARRIEVFLESGVPDWFKADTFNQLRHGIMDLPEF
jgi:hypothetical protein